MRASIPRVFLASLAAAIGTCAAGCASFVLDSGEGQQSYEPSFGRGALAEAPAITSTGPATVATPPGDAEIPPLSEGAGNDPIQSVLLISVDGLASRFLQAQIDAGKAPNFERVRREGATTDNARTEARISVTLPNHISMLTGRPAIDVPDLPPQTAHGITENVDPGDGVTIHSLGNPNLSYTPSIFDEAHDRGGYTALYSGKTKFALIRRSYAAGVGRADATGEDNGRDKVDDFDLIEDSSALVVEFLSDFEQGVARHPEGPNFALLHLRDPDAMGHAYGWGGPDYLWAVEYADVLLGGILDTIVSSPVLRDTVVMVTADHGGIDLGHYDTTLLEVVQIPFYVWGSRIPAGVDLYELSAGTRVDPLKTIPMDGLPDQPIRNGDAANLALDLMGLPPIDGSLHRGMRLPAVTESSGGSGDGGVDTPDASPFRDAD